MKRYTRTAIGLALIMAATTTSAQALPKEDVLAVKYLCDEGKTFSVNYILGAQVATFDGKAWTNVGIMGSTARRDGPVVNGVQQTKEIETTQYEFVSNGTQLYFITGKGQTATGGLLLPNSDDMLYCEATK